jgi:hypothetical protein
LVRHELRGSCILSVRPETWKNCKNRFNVARFVEVTPKAVAEILLKELTERINTNAVVANRLIGSTNRLIAGFSYL